MRYPDDLRDPMVTVSRFLNSDQIGKAEQFCRQVIKQQPENINILGMLGAILLKQAKIDEAENYLKKTIELAPTFAKPYEDLGVLKLSQNKPDEASRYFEKSVQLDPSQASAFFGLANALQKSGRKADAETAHREYLKLSSIGNALARASQLRLEGKPREAEDACDEVLEQDPDNIDALKMLAEIASDDERYVIAEGLLRKIAKSSPDRCAPIRDLGRFLVDRGRISEAVGLFQNVIDIDPSDHANQLALGNTLSILGRTAEALAAFEKCLALEPGEPSALLGRGHLLRIQGRRDEAIDSYRRCAAVQPAFGNAYWCLASLKGYRFGQEEIRDMHRILESDGLDPESEISFRFALARAYEDRGDFDNAWQQYERGNEQKRARLQYDPVLVETRHDRLIDVLTAGLLNEKGSRDTVSPTPIFILGVPRSGSTLIEQILASHSMVEGAGELPHIIMISSALGKNRPDRLAYPEVLRQLTAKQFASIGKSYIDQTIPHRHTDLPNFTDKMPANFSHVGFIHLILPNAKIIDARRNPIDTCVGNYRQLFAQGKKQSYDLQELGEYYLQYRRIMDHWDTVLPGRVLRVQYEDVVDDLEGQLRRILEYCELPWEDGCLDFFKSDRDVNTASAEQVRQPIYTDAIGYWKNYEKHLGELLEVLAPVLN
jgi:tetratricopeptide (TPR) repeat protein